MKGKKLEHLQGNGLQLGQAGVHICLRSILYFILIIVSISVSADVETYSALSYKAEVNMNVYGKLIAHDTWQRDCSTYEPTKLGFRGIMYKYTNEDKEEYEKILELRKNGAMRPFMKTHNGVLVEYMLIDPSFYSIESIPEEEMSSEEKIKYLASMKEVCAASGINTYEQLTEPLQRAKPSKKEYGMHEIEWELEAKEFKITKAQLIFNLPIGFRVYDWDFKVVDEKGKVINKTVNVSFAKNRGIITFEVVGGLEKKESIRAAVWFPSTNLKTESYLYKVAQKVIVKFKDPFFLRDLYTGVSLILILGIVVFVSSRDRWF